MITRTTTTTTALDRTARRGAACAGASAPGLRGVGGVEAPDE
ncbi:hypothetical protein ACMHYB_14930 [Sorangium sp. So ce1128]